MATTAITFEGLDRVMQKAAEAASLEAHLADRPIRGSTGPPAAG